MRREEMHMLRTLQWELAEGTAPFRVASEALKKVLDSCEKNDIPVNRQCPECGLVVAQLSYTCECGWYEDVDND